MPLFKNSLSWNKNKTFRIDEQTNFNKISRLPWRMTRFFPSVDRNLCVTATTKQSRQYRSFVRSVRTASAIRHFLQVVVEQSDFSVEHSDKVSASESNSRSPSARLHIFFIWNKKKSENFNFCTNKFFFLGNDFLCF